MKSKRRVWTVAVGALLLLGCRRESESQATPAPSATPAAPSPADLEARRDQAVSEAPVPASPEKNTIPANAQKPNAGLGDWLESDLYFFKMRSTVPCGKERSQKATTADPGSAPEGSKQTPTLLGVEIEIKAKLPMSIHPRDVTLHDGGVIYYADLDLKRRFQGCTPRLKLQSLKRDGVAKGYVVFEVPPPEPKQLHLSYRPTRWGGAGRVYLSLPECVACADDRKTSVPLNAAAQK